jgi:hypothetical protein
MIRHARRRCEIGDPFRAASDKRADFKGRLFSELLTFKLRPGRHGSRNRQP